MFNIENEERGLKNKKCLRCDSTIVTERDCPECDGFGQIDEGSEVFCEICEGVGSINGQWECIDCGHEWDE